MDYFITEVAAETNDWSNNYGSYRSYMVRFEGVDSQVEISRKKLPDDTVKNAPEVGQKLTGTITVKENGIQKFKQEYGQQGSQTAAKPSKTENVDWDAKDKRIVHQHSQTAAIALLAAADKPVTVSAVKTVAKELTDDVYTIAGGKDDLTEMPF